MNIDPNGRLQFADEDNRIVANARWSVAGGLAMSPRAAHSPITIRPNVAAARNQKAG
ncbi:MAG: hypothetical protein HZC24_06425 [Rhodocyclales bacterium]|nr:hypothetical protein [Rhodocyclales bacterium]